MRELAVIVAAVLCVFSAVMLLFYGFWALIIYAIVHTAGS